MKSNKMRNKKKRKNDLGKSLLTLIGCFAVLYLIGRLMMQPSEADKREAAEIATIQSNSVVELKEQDAENAKDTVTHQWFEQKIQQHEQNMRDNVIIAAEKNAEESDKQ